MFITLEGPEGAGKSTLAVGLSAAVENLGRKVLVTREPGAGDFGKKIRSLLLHGEAMESKAELFLFLADRSQHVARIVRPALADGSIVICDRHIDSTVVYQGYGRGMDLSQLRSLNQFATDGLTPDLTLLLDLDPSIGLARRTDRNRLDDESIQFHEKVRQGFLLEAAHAHGRFFTLDATRPPEEILAMATKAVMVRLDSKTSNPSDSGSGNP